MKNVLYSIIICLCFCSLHGDEPDNLLENGNFESSGAGDITGWKTVYKPDGTSFSVSAKGKFPRGKYSAVLNDKRTAGSGQQLCISSGHLAGIVPGKEYSLTFYAKSSSNKEQKLVAFFYTSPVKNGKHWYKYKKLDLTNNWKKYSFETKLPDAAEWGSRKMEIRFAIPGGAVFLDDIILSKSVKKEYEKPVSRNILENSGFDNGVTGWLTCQYYAASEIDNRMLTVDHNVKHKGNASLKLNAYGMGVYSRRYQFRPDTLYTLSFYMRADSKNGDGINIFLRDLHYKTVSKLKLKPSQLSNDWKRYSMTFKSPSLGEPFANSFLIRIDPLSTVWVDSFQLEEGEMTDYTAAPQVGLSFAPRGIYYQGRAGAIDLPINLQKGTDFNKTTVQLSCIDLHGNVVLNKTTKVSPSQEQTISIPVNFSKTGVLEVKAELISSGKKLAQTEWRILVLNNDSPIPPNKLIGTDIRVGNAPYSYVKFGSEIASLAGVGLNRSFYNNMIIRDKSKMRHDSSEILKLEKAAYGIEKDAGRETVIVLFNPDRYSPLQYHNLRKMGKLPEQAKLSQEINILAGQAVSVASTLSSEINILEILNEPNLWRVAGKRLMPPELYVRIIKAVADKVKKACPDMRIAANVNGIDFPYISDLFKLGVARYIDVFTIHPYRATAENPPVYEEIKKLRKLIDGYKPEIKIINDEQYYGSRDIVANGEFDRKYCAPTQDDCVARTIQTALHGIAADLVPFSLHGNLYYEGITDCPYYGYVFCAYRTLSVNTYGTEKADQIDISKRFRVFAFKRDDGKTLVSINTRDKDTSVRFDIRCKDISLMDCEGNVIPNGAITVGYLPFYYLFGDHYPYGKVIEIVKKAEFSETGFPVEVTASLSEGGNLKVTLQNTSQSVVKGVLSITKKPAGWDIPNKLKFSIMPLKSFVTEFQSRNKKLLHRNISTLNYTGEAEGIIVKRAIKIPAFVIPHTRLSESEFFSEGEIKGIQWIKLGEEALSANFNPSLPHQGTKDLSAEMAVMWNADGLFVIAKVVDDKFVAARHNNMLHDFDSIQLYLNSRTDVKHSSSDVICYSLGSGENNQPIAWLNQSPGTRFIGWNNAVTGLDADVKVDVQAGSKGYILKAFFPAHTIPGISLKSGSLFSFSALINDNDGKGRKQGLTLGPALTEPYNKPAIWPCVQLQ